MRRDQTDDRNASGPWLQSFQPEHHRAADEHPPDHHTTGRVVGLGVASEGHTADGNSDRDEEHDDRFEEACSHGILRWQEVLVAIAECSI